MSESVLQWNIWIHEDIENIVKTLKEIDADIVCVQELTSGWPGQHHTDTVNYVASELDYHVHASTPMGPKNRDWKQFNAIFSRYALFDQTQTWVNPSIADGDGYDESRSYIEASTKVGNKVLRIGTTHLTSIENFVMTERQFRETDRLVAQIAGKSSLILAGDFNEPPNSYAVQEVEKHLRNAGPSYNQNTWTTKPLQHNNDTLPLNWRLDYVFASNDLHVVSSEIIDTPYSDHLPILVKFN